MKAKSHDSWSGIGKDSREVSMNLKLCAKVGKCGEVLQNLAKNTLSRSAADTQSEVCSVRLSRYLCHIVDTWECSSIDTCERHRLCFDAVKLTTSKKRDVYST